MTLNSENVDTWTARTDLIGATAMLCSGLESFHRASMQNFWREEQSGFYSHPTTDFGADLDMPEKLPKPKKRKAVA